jgi:ankyrin repeat protein
MESHQDQKLLRFAKNPDSQTHTLTQFKQLVNANENLLYVKKPNTGDLCLHEACRGGRLDFVKFLIEDKGMNIDSTNNYNDTPLHRASQYGQLEIVKYLVQRNANLEIEDLDNWTALHQAASQNQKEVYDYLVKAGADPNKKTSSIGGKYDYFRGKSAADMLAHH